MHALKKHRPLRRVTLAAVTTVTGVVLLLSLKPHTPPSLAQASSPSSQSASSGSSSGSSGTSKSTGTKTVTGDSVQTRYGPVQVRVTVKNGRITDVTAVAYPQDNPRDQEINSYAIPQLKREVLAAQSAQIDSVSGATYTSGGYTQSLQSALDSAGV